MRVEIKTVCNATVYETWEVDVADELVGNELHDAAWQALWEGNADLIEDEHDDEHDRQVISGRSASAVGMDADLDRGLA